MRANVGAIAIAIVVAGAGVRSLGAQQSMSHDTAMAKDGMAKDGMKHDAMGHDAMGRDAMGRDAMGRDAMGRDAMGHDAMGPSVAFTKGETSVTGGYQISGAMGHQTLTLTPDFSLGNAPTPFVVLSTTTGLGASPVWLGALKQHKGTQTFEIPAGTDLSHYDHVVIWCKSQKVTLASADLSHGAISRM